MHDTHSLSYPHKNNFNLRLMNKQTLNAITADLGLWKEHQKDFLKGYSSNKYSDSVHITCLPNYFDIRYMLIFI